MLFLRTNNDMTVRDGLKYFAAPSWYENSCLYFRIAVRVRRTWSSWLDEKKPTINGCLSACPFLPTIPNFPGCTSLSANTVICPVPNGCFVWGYYMFMKCSKTCVKHVEVGERGRGWRRPLRIYSCEMQEIKLVTIQFAVTKTLSNNSRKTSLNFWRFNGFYSYM